MLYTRWRRQGRKRDGDPAKPIRGAGLGAWWRQLTWAAAFTTTHPSHTTTLLTPIARARALSALAPTPGLIASSHGTFTKE